jgi:cbb3-type cytochrome oxidase subunit 3
MRELLTTVDPTVWHEFSAIFFGTCFCALLFWVFWPTRKKVYQDYSKLPLDTD